MLTRQEKQVTYHTSPRIVTDERVPENLRQLAGSEWLVLPSSAESTNTLLLVEQIITVISTVHHFVKYQVHIQVCKFIHSMPISLIMLKSPKELHMNFTRSFMWNSQVIFCMKFMWNSHIIFFNEFYIKLMWGTIAIFTKHWITVKKHCAWFLHKSSTEGCKSFYWSKKYKLLEPYAS